jgi:hypothetical protein
VEFGFLSVGDPLIPPRHACYITKHLKLVSIYFGPKFLCGCFKFEGLKVELGFFYAGGTPYFEWGGDVKSPNI